MTTMFDQKAQRIPLIGDSVQYKHRGKWMAAVITYVHQDLSCSLTIFPRGHEILVQDQSYRGDDEGSWRWPKKVGVEN